MVSQQDGEDSKITLCSAGKQSRGDDFLMRASGMPPAQVHFALAKTCGEAQVTLNHLYISLSMEPVMAVLTYAQLPLTPMVYSSNQGSPEHRGMLAIYLFTQIHPPNLGQGCSDTTVMGAIL